MNRLLVVEDDPTACEILAESLRAEGYEVVTAANAYEAEGIFRKDPPFGLLLLDEGLPGLTGRHLLMRWRRQGVLTPAIFVSGSLEMSLEERLQLGVQDVLRKPVSAEALARAVRSALDAPPAGQPR